MYVSTDAFQPSFELAARGITESTVISELHYMLPERRLRARKVKRRGKIEARTKGERRVKRRRTRRKMVEQYEVYGRVSESATKRS